MNWMEPTIEGQEMWAEWVEERPDAIQALVAKYKFAPWKLYKLKTSGHRVIIHSIDEPKEGEPTLTVIVNGKFNFVAFERRVFGIKPEDLEECDLPRSDEPLGSANMTIEEARAFLANRPS
jgi:hypothetical protein